VSPDLGALIFPMTTITASEIDSLKFHTGHGSISVDAEPCISYHALFEQIIAPNLTTGPETTATGSIAAGVSTVTPASLTGILPYARLIIDVGADVEAVTVKSVSVGSFVATFQRAHVSGVPIAVTSGTARLRMLLWQADQAWTAFQDQSVGATAGLRSVDKGDVVWADGAGFAVLAERQKHYRAICAELASLVRVVQRSSSSGAITMAVY
jgi:hypothetical protein